MHGPALARWVRRHSEGARLLGALQLADEAVQLATEQAQRQAPGAGPREVRAYIARHRGR